MRAMTVVAIREEFARIKKKALIEITTAELEIICGQDSLSLNNAITGYETGFPQLLLGFARIPLGDFPARQAYLIEHLLDRSSAAIATQPSLNLHGMCLTALPYKRALTNGKQEAYHHEYLNFTGAQLHPEAAINVIRGGGDITNISWRFIDSADKEKLLCLQALVSEARSFLGPDQLNPRGIQELLDRVIDPTKTITRILAELRAHCLARRESCLVRYCCCFYKRDIAIQRFYQKWSAEAVTEAAPTERTGLLATHPVS